MLPHEIPGLLCRRIRSPTQRTGDAPAALRPPQTEHKAAQSWLPTAFGVNFQPPSRASDWQISLA
ncbi:hypothetical protein BMR02_14670 [Methylococcaceae bacterium HT1]|nr:hypothetical protein BMR02_14670 [Methylococcaceae bacterium HT1]